MISASDIKKFVDSRLEGTPCFVVDVKVGKDNEIKVEIDSMQSIDIDFCITLSKAIEEAFPRDKEDYELEVGSAGITAPFKVVRQYEKNVGKDVEVLACNGKKYIGTLLKVYENGFVIRTKVKFKPEGKKKAEEREEEITFAFGEVNSVRYHFQF